ncbi:hypothetical protein [Mucilaginibacter sp. UR6-11]|uniref:hypothetical protein n=1 Tax=Mucilaginibacter sp. UR6-11 TaxID=1435644 RepID=UPI001E5775AC|nr:hypothetical protein [Mucilaginibacter sp. UR6-11]MCC8424369.1 hypothetical protein [Mucilaginibacter sp. UR6-11]
MNFILGVAVWLSDLIRITQLMLWAFPADRSGPGFPFIRLQALRAQPVSISIPNAAGAHERAPPTHPIIASLDHPLFRKRERGLFVLCQPSFPFIIAAWGAKKLGAGSLSAPIIFVIISSCL